MSAAGDHHGIGKTELYRTGAATTDTLFVDDSGAALTIDDNASSRK
jgi:hypothetical protein